MQMLDLLVEEFALVGLSLNAKKENLVGSDSSLLVDVAVGLIEVVR